MVKMNKIKDFVLNGIKGLAMGSADIIPGVSGGTIALITGIYPRLIQAIKETYSAISQKEIFLIFTNQKKRKEIFSKIDFLLLLPLLMGIFIAVFSLSNIISHLVTSYPIATYSFFVGLIISSAIILSLESGLKRLSRFAIMIVGLILGSALANISTIFEFSGWTILFLSGAIAITAMILPGISGSLIILMLGQYERMLNAVRNLDILPILIFISGCIIGLGMFSNLLHHLMKNHEKKTKSFLVGLMLGSIRYQWNIISVEVTNAVDISSAIIFIAFGIILISIINMVARQKNYVELTK